MSKEQIEAAIAEARVEGALARRVTASNKVPAALAKVLVEALDLSNHWSRADAIAEHDFEIEAALDELGDGGVQDLIPVLLPRLEPAIRAAWDLLLYRPFGDRSFRWPRYGPAQSRRRGHWLIRLAIGLGDFDRDIVWVATYAAHLDLWMPSTEDVAWLLAGALHVEDSSADAVLELLHDSLAGRHPVARMHHGVPRALLNAGLPHACELCERTLVAAQRQEGLRQSILEAVHQSHPDSFRRMLRVLLEEDLSRFSATTRAAETWIGIPWSASNDRTTRELLEGLRAVLEEPVARSDALSSDDAPTAYLALWSMAFEDVESVVDAAASMAEDPAAERRLVALRLLSELEWAPARPILLRGLKDPDLRVATVAFEGLDRMLAHGDSFDAFEEFLRRIPEASVSREPLACAWMEDVTTRTGVVDALRLHLGERPPTRLLRYESLLGPWERRALLRQLAGIKPVRVGQTQGLTQPLVGPAHEFALRQLGHSSIDVRDAAFEALASTPVRTAEVEQLVELLRRKGSDLRRDCFLRLDKLADDRFFEVAEQLLRDKLGARREAGLELLRLAVEDGRAPATARELARAHRTGRRSWTKMERTHLEAIEQAPETTVQLDDALGLVDPTKLLYWPEPQPRDIELASKAAAASVEQLAELILEHADHEVTFDDTPTFLLIEAGFRIPIPGDAGPSDETGAEPPLGGVWRDWVLGRGDRLRDRDGLELVRAIAADRDDPTWQGPATRKVCGAGEYGSGQRLLEVLLAWCLSWDAPDDPFTLLLDDVENCYAQLTEEDVEALREEGNCTYLSTFDEVTPSLQRRFAAHEAVRSLEWVRAILPDRFGPEHVRRRFALGRQIGLRTQRVAEVWTDLDDFLDAFEADTFGDAAVHEWTDLLVGRFSHVRTSMLQSASRRVPPDRLARHPVLVAALERCRARIVELEVQRGDLPTVVTPHARALRWSGGLETLRLVMRAFGRERLARSGSEVFGADSRRSTLSRLVARSNPRPDDTHDAFAAWAREDKIREDRLVELAVFAPQWAPHVAHALRWSGLESAVWWIHAHTKEARWDLDGSMQAAWESGISEYTPIPGRDLMEGGVDVAWFEAIRKQLGKARWTKLDKAAQYASTRGGHKRAQLFADAMTGVASEEELRARIDEKRHQDSVRAWGLLPLSRGVKKRKQQLLERYRRLQEFKHESRQFGAQRQESEGRAVAIGMENLARTAGYRDPQRLQWAMEMESVRDLPIARDLGETTITLEVDSEGRPGLVVVKNGKPQKSVPAKLRKDKAVVELKARLKQLRQQASRVRVVLEEAMCRGDEFEGDELQKLLQHPILAPGLARLVFVGEDIVGYPVESGRALADRAGKLEPVRRDEPLRIAHPHDLFARGDWAEWQQECFRRERIQPFKQVFRELYPLTESERRDPHCSRRYAGHQVQPRQALALLGSRGWVARPEEGVSRTDHQQGITTWLSFEEHFYTPAEVEGLTLETVRFTRRQDGTAILLEEIPPRLFSEAMRDLDLVVSVAHQGGVDPEATASTIEMRASLMRETCRLLRLDNVTFKEHHALIEGERATYALHLGSAVARLLHGPTLLIVAVHSQHRGRLFLPFADDDPRTAEVLSKMLLLARDREIQDPWILDQIARG